MTATHNAPPLADAQRRQVASRAVVITAAGLLGYGAFTAYLSAQSMAWQAQTLLVVLAGSSLATLAGLGPGVHAARERIPEAIAYE